MPLTPVRISRRQANLLVGLTRIPRAIEYGFALADEATAPEETRPLPLYGWLETMFANVAADLFALNVSPFSYYIRYAYSNVAIDTGDTLYASTNWGDETAGEAFANVQSVVDRLSRLMADQIQSGRTVEFNEDTRFTISLKKREIGRAGATRGGSRRTRGTRAR